MIDDTFRTIDRGKANRIFAKSLVSERVIGILLSIVQAYDALRRCRGYSALNPKLGYPSILVQKRGFEPRPIIGACHFSGNRHWQFLRSRSLICYRFGAVCHLARFMVKDKIRTTLETPECFANHRSLARMSMSIFLRLVTRVFCWSCQAKRAHGVAVVRASVACVRKHVWRLVGSPLCVSTRMDNSFSSVHNYQSKFRVSKYRIPISKLACFSFMFMLPNHLHSKLEMYNYNSLIA